MNILWQMRIKHLATLEAYLQEVAAINVVQKLPADSRRSHSWIDTAVGAVGGVVVVLPWHNLVMVELLIFFLLSFRSSSIFFVPAQLWRHDRSTECPLEGKHWAACSCTNMILMFLLSAAALHGPHTALPGGSAVAQLGDGRVAHFLSFELSKLIHLLCASPIVAPRSLYRVPTGRKTLGSLQLHKHIC